MNKRAEIEAVIVKWAIGATVLVVMMIAASLLTACGTPTPGPTATPTPRPTATPTPEPVANSDCAGCPAFMPGVSNDLMKAFTEWPAKGRHPDNLLLFACSRDYRANGKEVFGSTGPSSERDILVSGLPVAKGLDNGQCYAITSRYDGQEEVCWLESPFGSCSLRVGVKYLDVFTFKAVGEVTAISTSEYRDLIDYVLASKYPD